MHITLVTVVTQTDAPYAKRFFTHLTAVQRYYGQKLTVAPPFFLENAETEFPITATPQTTIPVILLSEDLLAVLDYHPIKRRVAPETSPALRVLPVLLRPCSWDEPGSIFQGRWPLPRNHTPISLWQNSDSAWSEVVKEIRQMLEGFYQADQKQHRPLTQSPQAAPSPPRTAQVSPQKPAPMQPATTDKAHPRDHHPTRDTLSSPTATLLIYSEADQRTAQQCFLHLKTAGLEVIDAQVISAGSSITTVFRKNVQRSCRAVFLMSADFLADMGNEMSIPALAVSTLPTTLLAHSFLVVVRPCAYERLLSERNPHPQVIIAPSSSKHVEAFWLAFARRLQGNAPGEKQ